MPPAFSETTRQKIARLQEAFPDHHSLLIPVLELAQEEFGHLSTEVLTLVGSELGLPTAQVAGVATFYDNLFTAPKGRHVIRVCGTLSCRLAGAGEVIDRFRELLGVEPGQTTPDGLITLKTVECLACCGTAPGVMVDDDYFESFRPEDCASVVAALRDGRVPEGGSGVPGGEVTDPAEAAR
jgi:NADH-quinone oxidoreductase subunit E